MLEKIIKSASLVISSLAIAGCTTFVPQSTKPMPPIKPLDSRLEELTDITSDVIPTFESKLLENESNYILTEYSMRENDQQLVRFYHYKSKNKPEIKHPLVILFNILKDKNMMISGFLASSIAEDKSIDCIIIKPNNVFLRRQVIRPIVGDLEVKPESRYRDFNNTIFDYDNYNAFNVKNLKKIIKYWIPNNAGLNGDYCFAGISLGGIQSISLTPFFPDSKMSIGVMAGGDYSDIYKSSEEDLVVLNKAKLIEQYAKNYKGKSDAQELAESDLYNALDSRIFRLKNVVESIPREKIRMAISLYDTSVPTHTQKWLYNKLGKPEARFFPCGHYSMAIFILPLRSQLLDWVDDAFGVKKDAEYRRNKQLKKVR